MSSEKKILMFVDAEGNRLEPLNAALFKRFLQDFGQGAKVTVTIESYSREKNPAQLALFHIIVNKISQTTGQDKTQVKDHLKYEYGVSDENGKLLSCSDYTEKQMSKLIDGSITFARDYCGIIIPTREELTQNNIR